MSRFFLAILFLVFIFDCQSSWAKSSVDPSKKNHNADNFKKSVFLSALDFFDSEDDFDGLNNVKRRMIALHLEDREVVEKLIQIFVKRKDRIVLKQTMSDLSDEFGCRLGFSAASRQRFCNHMKILWDGNLDSIFFFEESAGKIEQLRRLFVAKDCASMLPVLKQIELKEGVFAPLIDAKIKWAQCVSDGESEIKFRQEKEELRIFSSEI